jgi:glycosyltransferase involved in cell wall biosynthesis
MNLLSVDNGAIVARGDARLLNRHSAAFYLELASLIPGLALAQGLVDYGDTDTLGDFDLSREKSIALETLPWRIKGFGRIYSYARAIPWILRLVRRSDHLYLFLPGHLPLMFTAAARLLRRPYGVYLRGELHLGTARMKSALSGARFVLASTETLCAEVRPLCPNVAVVTPMIEIRGDDVLERRDFRSEDPWRLLFVGRVERRKGVGELIDAVRRLSERGISLELRLAGGGPELDGFRTRAERLGLDQIRFLGVISDRSRLAKLFRESDLFVLPTHTEGFPRVLYEAMAHGLPVLTTFVGGIPAVMKDGENCLRIEVGDPDGLAATLERALASPELRRRLSEGGTRTIRCILREERPSHARQVAERILR